jgi:hypothetical protein
MLCLNRDQILAATDLKSEPVETPEWGEGSGVFVRSLTAVERDTWDKREYGSTKPEMIGYKARFCVLAMVNEGGTRLFADADADALAKKSAGVIERVFTVAAKLNGLLANNSADIEKNSEAVPSPE